MARRVGALTLVALLTLGCAHAASGDSTGPAQAPALDHRVVVDLAVDWRPVPELTAAERRKQRRRIQAAQARLLRALGDHGRLRRELHATAQLALAVDDAGLALLRRHRLVAAVHEDRPDPTG